MTNSKAYLTNDGTVKAFFSFTYESGYAQSKQDSNVFFEGNKLYSYGYHFPMVVAHDNYFFVNADSYSPTTNKHQSLVQRHVPSSRKIEIPFSALKEAGIRIEDVEVVDKESSRYVEIPTKNRETGEMEMKPTHLMGSTLFKMGERYFLSGIDESAKDLWNGFFLTELVGKVETIEEAYESMKPEEVKNFEEQGFEVVRQGEYFFVKCLGELEKLINDNIKSGIYTLEKKVALSHKKRDTTLEGKWNFQQSRHIVTNLVRVNELVFAKGTCRHVAGEHKMLKLDGWHFVYENVQEKSWTAEGRVD